MVYQFKTLLTPVMQVWSLLSDYVHLDSKIKAIYIYVGILLKGCSKILEMELLSDISSIAHCGKYPYIYMYISAMYVCGSECYGT